MDDTFQDADLIPVSEWVYSLYEVKYSLTEGGDPIVTQYLTASCENHLESEIDRNSPWSEGGLWTEWKEICYDIGQPATVGRLYGRPISESSRSHAERFMAKMEGRP